VNATGWFRRHFSVSAKALAAYKQASSPTRLAVGEAACESTIYVNGEVVTGGTGGGGKGCLEFQAPQLDLEKIVAGDNVVAVRVHSQGGKAGTTAPHGYPGGLCDAGALAQHGVSVATGADWSPPSPFDPARTFNGRSYGYSVDGVGWYRLAFNHSINHLVIDEQTSIAFDGVYMNADFWLNGKHLGSHPYGYTYFHYDLTPLLVDGPNTIAVRVRNEGRNSRWYSGSGIFRHVRLITTPSVHIGQWGVVVQTTAISASSATVGLLVSAVNNGSSAASKAAIKATIMDGTGAVVASGSADVPSLAALNGSAEVKVPGMQIKSPKMWELASPHLYRVKVELQSTKGAPPGSNVDTVIETFGVRTIEFSTDGFKLNGKPVLLYGGCVHHDNGPLGSATIDRAEERRVENLKKLGYNAIRTSHNPVSPAFLDACDRLGVLVMHEAFDCWERGKNTDDYHVYFDQWWRRAVVYRKRNTNADEPGWL
jgi:beta-galactosidase